MTKKFWEQLCYAVIALAIILGVFFAFTGIHSWHTNQRIAQEKKIAHDKDPQVKLRREHHKFIRQMASPSVDLYK